MEIKLLYLQIKVYLYIIYFMLFISYLDYLLIYSSYINQSLNILEIIYFSYQFVKIIIKFEYNRKYFNLKCIKSSFLIFIIIKNQNIHMNFSSQFNLNPQINCIPFSIKFEIFSYDC